MKGKWLAIAAAALLVLLVVMWNSMNSSTATPAVAPTPVEVASSKVRSGQIDVAAAPAPVEPEAPVEDKPSKLDKMSDEFFFRFTEVVPHKLSRNAATCYTKPGSLHRNQKLVLKFDVRVRGGEVTVHDVKVDVSTLNDPALESCFIREVSRTTWRDDALPDYDWPDELVIRPERGLKKHWKSNLDYVGAEAPKQDRSVHPSPK